MSVKGCKVITYSSGTRPDNANTERIKSVINIIPGQSRADGNHVLLSVVIDLRELLHAYVNASCRRESRVRPVTTTLDL